MSLEVTEKEQKKPSITSKTFSKKVFVQTWGCQMNVSDTERMLGLLSSRNYHSVNAPEGADLILLNTCHIREKARHKLVSRLGELKVFKEQNPDMMLAVSGCVAQAESKSLADEVPFVDLIFGPDQIEDLPDLLEKTLLKKEEMQRSGAAAFASAHKPLVETGFDKKPYSIPIDVVPPFVDEDSEVSRFVNIIKGCNNFCTFCVVPFTRGREKSRGLEEIVKEARYFIESGAKEIVLLGQNVNSYGIDLLEDDRDGKKTLGAGRLPFADLLYAVAALPGLQRLRFTTSNPHDFTPQLAQAFADLPQITNQFHLPVQSGSNEVLGRMNRQYTREEYLERVAWIRAVRPLVAFSTDIIVGFPGESDTDFEQTISLVEEMNYSFIYAFKYSPRPGTAAARFRDVVSEEVKDRRLQALLHLQNKITLRQNKAEIGEKRQVLGLYQSHKDPGAWYGRTYEGRLTKVSSPLNLKGQMVEVLITEANATALVATLL